MKSTRILLVVATLFFAATTAWAIDIEGTEVVVPVAMHGPGALGTSWRTDLWINDLFVALGIPPQRGLQLDMHSAGAVPIYGYASVVRNDTGDAIIIFGTSPNN